jgi:hypothetical protein
MPVAQKTQYGKFAPQLFAFILLWQRRGEIVLGLIGVAEKRPVLGS